MQCHGTTLTMAPDSVPSHVNGTRNQVRALPSIAGHAMVGLAAKPTQECHESKASCDDNFNIAGTCMIRTQEYNENNASCDDHAEFR